MIADLKPYPRYRPTKLSWLDSIPEHWEILRNGRLFSQRKETGHGHLPILEVSLRTGVRVRDFDGSSRKQVMSDREKYQRAARGDIAYNMMRMWQGAVGVAPVDGLISPAYVVARAHDNVDANYATLVFRTEAYKGEIDCNSRGIVKDRNRLYWGDFKQIATCVPPPDEQRAIVRFLGHVELRITRYIRAKQQLIDLLEEQRQAILHQAVTRGLDPNVRMKPSRIEWLGDVPEHWELTRVKSEFECLNARRVPLSSTERGTMTERLYPYYGASGIIDTVDDYLFDDDLLLLAEDGANLVLRNLPLAIIARGKYWVNNHAHILKPRRGVLEFLAAAMETLNYTPWISGAAQPKLTKDRLMGIAIAVPSPEEQAEIMKAVASRTYHHRETIERARREIDLLREYCIRVIADVVTGKLDVREVAARLPDKSEDTSDFSGIVRDGTVEQDLDDFDEIREEVSA